ncbi:ThiF family adenylyltransferase [Actinomadura sp. LOL_016]|uniref:HesA/MoeB/ThiF family protein n=1 Tax=unclassified Actinomadura TaxID=2626254 RepID=UPI003A800593
MIHITARDWTRCSAIRREVPMQDEHEAARHESARNFFAWIDTAPRSSPYEAQSEIKDARVGLLGLGGTGTAVAAGLVSSGIGALHVADFDVVEESNLTRQLLYTEHDIGLPKVDRAVERLRAMNGRAKVTGDTVKADGPDGIAALMDDCDAFVLCADEPDPDIMFWTNDEDQREFKAHSRPLTEERPNAVIAASANISGHLCALEVLLYHLSGLPTQARLSGLIP